MIVNENRKKNAKNQALFFARKSTSYFALHGSQTREAGEKFSQLWFPQIEVSHFTYFRNPRTPLGPFTLFHAKQILVCILISPLKAVFKSTDSIVLSHFFLKFSNF